MLVPLLEFPQVIEMDWDRERQSEGRMNWLYVESSCKRYQKYKFDFFPAV